MKSPTRTEAALKQDRKILLAALAVLAGLAALYTLTGVGMEMTALQMTRMAGGDFAAMAMPPPVWTVGHWCLVFLMWWVMMVAMMLPSAAPVILLYAHLMRSARGISTNDVALVFVSGYLMVWAAFSGLATVAQWGLEQVQWIAPAMMTISARPLAGAILITAGLYQISPFKQACLSHCRSPMQFIIERRRAGPVGAAKMGGEHGAYCLGCCWALMVLLFVGGAMNLYWIAGLTILVGLEKLTDFGRSLSYASGLLLTGYGIVVLLWQ